MRIEITSTQAGASRTRASRTTVRPAVQGAVQTTVQGAVQTTVQATVQATVRGAVLPAVQAAVAWAGPPIAASSLRVDPSKRGPFSAGCATPTPVRWDAVRG